MNELRTLITQIFEIGFIFVIGSWLYVLAQGAAKNKRGRYVIRYAFYSAGYMAALVFVTVTVVIVAWTTYDLFKGVWW